MWLECVPWSDSFGDRINGAAGSDRGIIQHECENGISQCWQFSIDDEIIAHIVTRWEKENDTLVIVCYEGSDVLAFGKFAVKMCREANIGTIRFHTQKRGLIKLVKELKPEPLEYVMRINVNGQSE